MCDTGSVEPVHAEWDAADAPFEVDERPKHEATLWEGQAPALEDSALRRGWPSACIGEVVKIEAQIVNLSADGFRLQSVNPLQAPCGGDAGSRLRILQSGR